MARRIVLKRSLFPPKNRSPSLSSSVDEDEEDEEGDAARNNGSTIYSDAAVPKSSQPSEKSNPRIPYSDLNKAANPNSSTDEEDSKGKEGQDGEESEDDKGKKAEIRKHEVHGRKDEPESEDSNSDSDSPTLRSKPSPASRVFMDARPISSKSRASSSRSEKCALEPPGGNTQKRPAKEESVVVESRKRKKADLCEEEEETGTKKLLFQRIWSPEDEISILKGMIEFAEKGSDAFSDPAGFHEFVKNYFQVDMRKSQVSEKIRRTRKKYLNNARKSFGKEPSFSKDHDQMVYQLSKKLWGCEVETENSLDKIPVGSGRTIRKNADVKKAPLLAAAPISKYAAVKAEKSSLESREPENHAILANGANHSIGNIAVLYPYLNESLRSGGVMSSSGLGERDVRRAIELMGEAEAKHWDDRCKKLRWKEKDAFMERVTIFYELVKQCYDLVKSSKE